MKGNEINKFEIIKRQTNMEENEDLYIEPAFGTSYCGMEMLPIQSNYFDSSVDSYTQTIILYYDYFVQKVTIDVDYFLNEFEWESNMSVTETIMLGDNINGNWSAYIGVSHPLQNDWSFSGKISKVDSYNCSYQFVKTSNVKGEKDVNIESSGTIEVMYDSESNLQYIELGECTAFFFFIFA